jgi:hypothetical protein
LPTTIIANSPMKKLQKSGANNIKNVNEYFEITLEQARVAQLN